MRASLLLGAVFALLTSLVLTQNPTPTGQLITFAAFFAIGPALAAVGSAWLGGAPASLLPAVYRRPLRFAGMVAMAGMLIWSLRGVDVVLYHGDSWPHSAGRFVAGLATGAGLVLLTFVFHTRLQYRTAHWLGQAAKLSAMCVAIVTAISLFDRNVFADSLSYAPYTGPANIVMQGGVPLRDAFSQYGLNYLLFAGVLSILPYSFATAAALVSAINILYYLTYLLIAFKIAKHKSLVVIAATAILLFLHSSYFYNVTRTPSVLGMRFLPPLLLTASLCDVRPGAPFRLPSILCVMLASLWSIESLCFGAAAYCLYLLISGWGQRLPLRQLARNLLLLGASLAVPHILLTLGYLLLFRAPPEYGTYLQLVFGATTDPAADWTSVADPAVHTWALFGWGYGLGLAYAIYRAHRPVGRDGSEAGRAAVLASLCVVGVGELAYYVARSTTPLLVFLAWPLALVALWALDRGLGDGLASRRAAQVTMLVVAAATFSAMAGVFADRFFQPADAISSNSTILRSVLNSPWPVTDTWLRMSDTAPFPAPDGELHPGAPPRRIITYSYPYIQASLAFRLSQTWQASDREPLLLLPESATVLFYAHKPSRLGLAHPPVDGLSPALAARALERLQSVVSGDVVIVGNPAAWTQDVPLDRTILSRLSQTCAFSELERASDYPDLGPDARERVAVTAYRLKCGPR